MSRTFATALDQHKGVGPGFDTVRIVLAVSVLFWHSLQYTHSLEWHDTTLAGPIGPFVLVIVPAFFALSGFLVTGSLLRVRTLPVFISFRALRILPALIVEILLSAFVLGVIVTSFSLTDYFHSSLLWGYLTNIVGFVKYDLPGVFRDNPNTAVNGSLWTVPGEMICYLTLSALMLVGLASKRSAVLSVFLVALVFVYLRQRWRTDSWDLAFSGEPITQTRYGLVVCFYAGGLLYHFQERIPHRAPVAVLCAVASYICIQWTPAFYLAVGSFCIAYVVCYLGTISLPKIPLTRNGDYSYGIYLYHAPMIQALIWLSPIFMDWRYNFVAVLISVSIFSALSWHWIEKPALAYRVKFRPQERELDARRFA